jgi:hypothetical protein
VIHRVVDLTLQEEQPFEFLGLMVPVEDFLRKHVLLRHQLLAELVCLIVPPLGVRVEVIVVCVVEAV